MNTISPDPEKFPNLFIFSDAHTADMFTQNLAEKFNEHGIVNAKILRDNKYVNFTAESENPFKVSLNVEDEIELIFTEKKENL